MTFTILLKCTTRSRSTSMIMFKLITIIIMKICNIFSAICINLPGERTGKRGRPRIHRERIRLESIPLKKPEGADYYMGCREVITIYGRGNLYMQIKKSADTRNGASFPWVLTLFARTMKQVIMKQKHSGHLKIIWCAQPKGLNAF